jgi:hypothetical protein
MDNPLPSAPEKTIEALKQAIWSRRPILGDIMQKHGNKILSKYSEDFMDVNPAPGLDSRKPEIIAVIEELVTGRLGAEVGKGVAKQLTKLPLVSTADHHASIDHPFWVNANIISGIPLYEDPDPDIRYLIVLSFSSVSVNNASGYARGILFNGGNGSPQVIRLPILPDKVKMSVVYGTRTFTREDLTKAEGELLKKEKAGEISLGRGEQIRGFLEETFATDAVLGASQLCSQISRINFAFWRRIFHGPKGKKTDDRPLPDLVYFDIETLVTQLLLRIHLKDKSSLIHRVLFDPAFQPLIRTHFNNLAGSFSIEKGWGTYMFWGINEKQRRVSTKLQSGKLVFADSDVAIDWTPDAVWQALKNKQIFPSMLLCYLIVSLYYGFKCLGGFCQVHDLTVIKEAWRTILLALGETAEADAVVPVQTKELGGDGMVLSYMPVGKGDIAPATGIDMALSDDDTSFGKYVELGKRVTMMEMMCSMLPEMYTVLYSEADRDPALLALTPEQILRVTGVAEKLIGG